MHSIETFQNQKMVDAENAGFKFEVDLFKSIQIIMALVVIDNIETFDHTKIVVAENVGFRFKADLFK